MWPWDLSPLQDHLRGAQGNYPSSRWASITYWFYLTPQVNCILHRSPWWGWMVSSTSQKRKTVLFKFKILIKFNFKSTSYKVNNWKGSR
jgi:hypothetical protein